MLAAEPTRRIMARVNAPSWAAGLTLAGALVFVVLRLLIVADGAVARFAVVGGRAVDTALLPVPIPVVSANGYDGQYALRLAFGPLELERTAYGLSLDTPVRAGRIAYPALAWVLSAGQPAAVPWALVVVNLLGLGALGLIGGLLARAAGRHALIGLLLPAWPGFVFTLGRDLNEIAAAVGVAGGLLAWRRGRHRLAGVALALAVLSRESTAVVVAAVAVCWLVAAVPWPRWSRQTRPVEPGQQRPAVPAGGATSRRLDGSAAAAWAWVLPVAAFAAWQAYCWWALGDLPALVGIGDNLADPDVGTVSPGSPPQLSREAEGISAAGYALKLAQLSVLVAAALSVAAAGLRRPRLPARALSVPAHELVALGLSVLVAVRVFPLVWNDWAGFRAFSDVWVLAVVPLLCSRARLSWLFAGALVTAAGTAGMLVLVI